MISYLWFSKKIIASSVAATALYAVSAQAAPFTVVVGSDFAAAPASIFEGSTFTSTPSKGFFSPVAISTLGGAAVSAVGGFLGFAVTPPTDFPGRGSGILTYGPNTQFASFPTPATIPYSNGDNDPGLRATQNGQNYFGYAFFTNIILNSFAFETAVNTPISFNTSISAVPEPASWAMMILGMGMMGIALRRRKVTVRLARVG